MKKQCFSVATCIVKDKKILLLHRTDDFDVWEFPGGGIEFGESPEEAAVRETREEANVKAEVRFLTINSHITPKPQNHHHIWFFYVCRKFKGKVKISNEHVDYRWFTLKEMEELPNLALSVEHIMPELKKVVG